MGGSFRLFFCSLSSGTSLMTTSLSFTYFSTADLWSLVRLPERNTNVGLEPEIVQLGRSYASKQSRHIDGSVTEVFWMSLLQSGEEVIHCGSLGHTDTPHTSLVL